MLVRIRTFPRSAVAQLMQSATSLCATLIFSHVLSPSQFGILAIYWVFWTLIMAMNRAVFGEQLLAAGDGAGDARGYSAFMLAWLGMLAALTISIVVATDSTALMPGVVYIILFVSVDAVRYWALAQPGDKVWPPESLLVFAESIRFAISIFVLTFLLVGVETPALQWFSAASSLFIAAVFPGAFVVSWAAAKRFLRSRRRFEAIMLFQFLALSGTGQLIPLVAVPVVGPAAYGTLNFTNRLIAPVTILGSAFQPALIRYFANTDGASTPRRLLRAVALFSAVASITMIGCFVVVRYLGHLFIDPAQFDGVLQLLLACLVGVGAVAVGQPGGALIRVRRLGRVSLLGHAVGVLATVLGVLAAVQTADIVVVAWALSLGVCTTVVVTYGLLVRHLLRERAGR